MIAMRKKEKDKHARGEHNDKNVEITSAKGHKTERNVCIARLKRHKRWDVLSLRIGSSRLGTANHVSQYLGG